MGYCETVSVAADKKVTIVDLCSGKGYLSMLLSEILPRDKVHSHSPLGPP